MTRSSDSCASQAVPGRNFRDSIRAISVWMLSCTSLLAGITSISDCRPQAKPVVSLGQREPVKVLEWSSPRGSLAEGLRALADSWLLASTSSRMSCTACVPDEAVWA